MPLSCTAPDDVEMKQRRGELIDHYDRKADAYDGYRSNAYGNFYFRESYRAIDALLGDVPADALHVDVPAGTGRFFFYLRDQGRRHRMVGLDISGGMLAACRRTSAERGDDVVVARADAFRLPLADESVDLLTSLRMFHLFPNERWPAMLAEWRRVLRPGGILITELRNQARAKISRLLSPYFRKRRQVHPHTYVAASDVRPLFADWTDLTLQGIGLDGLRAVYRVAAPVGRAIHALETHTPLRFLSKTLLVRARKPE